MNGIQVKLQRTHSGLIAEFKYLRNYQLWFINKYESSDSECFVKLINLPKMYNCRRFIEMIVSNTFKQYHTKFSSKISKIFIFCCLFHLLISYWTFSIGGAWKTVLRIENFWMTIFKVKVSIGYEIFTSIFKVDDVNCSEPLKECQWVKLSIKAHL